MLQIKNFVKAQSLEEAYALNQSKSNLIIGGMHWLKMGNKSVDTVIDLSGLGLDQIVETEEAFEIGCMTSLRQLEIHEGLNRYAMGAVRDAVKDIVGVQFRNTATIGGSLFGRYGFSDVLSVFLAMDVDIVCHNAGVIPLAQYANMKADRDILVKVIVKKTPIQMAYLAPRHAKTDFPMLTCCVAYWNGQWHATMGAAPGKAKLVLDENHLLPGPVVSKEEADAFGAYVTEQITFGTNMRGTEEYRRAIAPVLVRRALLAAGAPLAAGKE